MDIKAQKLICWLGMFSGLAMATDPQPVPAAGSSGTPPAAPASTVACSHGKYHEFDFWLGEWAVFGPQGKLAGRSSITRTLGDCVIHEHWRNASSTVEGRSFNLYDGLSKVWRQYWVDNAGGTLMLEGGIVHGSMVLTGTRPHLQTGAPQLQRITWTANQDGSVRQLWETSDDAGKTWQSSFDGTYRRHAD